MDQILPKFVARQELSAVGGDGAMAQPANYLNPFKRKTKVPVVFWSGIMASDSTLRTVNYTPPEFFNGSLRIMAVAVADNAVGSADKSALLRNDFILAPNVPTVVAPEDKFEVNIDVTNNVKNVGQLPISVTLTSTAGATILGKNNQTLVIGQHQDKIARFLLQATQKLGNTTLTFTAGNADKLSRMQTTISVRPATPYQTTLISGVDRATSKVVAIPRQLYPDFRTQTVMAASTPQILIQGLQLYLNSYPYGCTEQVVSKGFGYLALQPLAANNADTTQISQKLSNTISVLQQRHTSEGGFSYWPGSSVDSADSQFSSVYALHFLTDTHEKSYAVPDDLLTTGLDYLRNLASTPTKTLNQARIQAYGIYVLSRNEVVTTNYLTNLQLFLEQNYHNTWRHDIVSSFIAATYKLLKDDKTADDLIKGYQLQATDASIASRYNLSPNFFDPATTNALYLYLLAKDFPEKFQALGERSVLTLADDVANNYIDTTSAAYTILALSAYQPAPTQNNTFLMGISEILPNQQSHNLFVGNTLTKSILFSPDAVKLQFSNQNQNLYFYQIYMAGFDRNLPMQAFTQGLEIAREYWHGTQQITSTANTITQGTDITVHLRIRALNNKQLDHIAIVDLLPGGFEVIPNTFKGSYDYFDAREDRVIFYTSVGPMVKDITYHIKPIAKGDFVVPPAFAESMYNQRIMARGVASRILVN